MVSWSHVLSPQGEDSSHSSTAPAWGPSHRRQSSTNCSHWVLPTGCSSSQTTPTWVLPMGCSPSGTGCSSVGPPRGHKPCQQTYSSVGSSLHGSTGPGRTLLQHRVSTGSQFPLGASTCSSMGSFMGSRWISNCFTMDLPPWAAGDRGTSALKPGTPPPCLLCWPWCLQSSRCSLQL